MAVNNAKKAGIRDPNKTDFNLSQVVSQDNVMICKSVCKAEIQGSNTGPGKNVSFQNIYI